MSNFDSKCGLLPASNCLSGIYYLVRFRLAGLISQTAKLGAQGVPSCRSFSFEELKEATDDFDSSRFLGEGSLGKVWFVLRKINSCYLPISCLLYSACFDSLQLYRGTLENGSSIAIRCLVLTRKFSSQSIRGHLDWMSKLNHPHLLSFLGHCTQTSGEHEPAATILYLVYEYMPNGSYRTHLSGQIDMSSILNVKLKLSVLGNSMLLEYCL